MKVLCRSVCLIALLQVPVCAADDPRVTEALYRVSREAASLWHTAPGFVSRETVTQKVLAKRKNRFRVGVGSSLDGNSPAMYQTREIVSYYSLGAFKGAPEALREFRETFSVDGQQIQDPQAARTKFIEELSADNAVKQNLIAEFEKKCVAGSATDFGQLILVFTRANLDKYGFEFGGETRIGVDRGWQINFKQEAGSQSLHISDGRKKLQEKLNGEIWVRQGDYLPLRIVLYSTRTRDKNEIRDEAKVDYVVVSGTLLPAALTYRRFVNDELAMQSVYRYTDWEQVAQK